MIDGGAGIEQLAYRATTADTEHAAAFGNGEQHKQVVARFRLPDNRDWNSYGALQSARRT